MRNKIHFFSCLFLLLLSSCASSTQETLENAILNGEVGKVKLLLDEKSADPNQLLEGHQQTPVEMAASLGHGKIVELLLRAGADPNNSFGAISPLWRAMEAYSEDGALALVQAGADISQLSQDGNHPLYFAVLDEQVKLVRALLKQGASPELINQNETPLHAAAENGNTDIIFALIDAGAYINAKDEFGESPLFAAVRKNHIPAIEMLYQYEADINFQNEIGETVLHEVMYFPDSLTLEILIEFGGKVNQQDNSGETPLHRAAEAGEVLLTEILLNNQANPQIVNLEEQTAKEIAQQENKTEILEFFNFKRL